MSYISPDTNLTMSDVQLLRTMRVLKLISKRRTDPFRHGVKVHLFVTGHDICTVSALIYYLNAIPQPNRTAKQPPFINR